MVVQSFWRFVTAAVTVSDIVYGSGLAILPRVLTLRCGFVLIAFLEVVGHVHQHLLLQAHGRIA